MSGTPGDVNLSKRPEDLLQNWPDGRIKMFLTQRALHFRNEHVELFRNGDYLPLRASGTLADCCISFARRLNRHWAVVIVPRETDAAIGQCSARPERQI